MRVSGSLFVVHCGPLVHVPVAESVTIQHKAVCCMSSIQSCTEHVLIHAELIHIATMAFPCQPGYCPHAFAYIS